VVNSSNHARPRASALISAGITISSRGFLCCRHAGQQWLGFDATPLEPDCRRQLNRAIAFA
jgi:hypothetical protein